MLKIFILRAFAWLLSLFALKNIVYDKHGQLIINSGKNIFGAYYLCALVFVWIYTNAIKYKDAKRLDRYGVIFWYGMPAAIVFLIIVAKSYFLFIH